MLAQGPENNLLRLGGNYKEGYLCRVNLYRIELCVLLNLLCFTGNNDKILLRCLPFAPCLFSDNSGRYE